MCKKSILLLCLASIALLSIAGVRPEVQLRSQAGVLLKVKSSDKLKHLSPCDGLDIYSSSDGGFVIMANDDRLPALLAYSPDGHVSSSSDNPGFNWWLNAIRRAMLRSAPKRETTKPDPNRFPSHVDPLITTMWGQREPFKFMCPFDHYVADQSLYGTYQPDSGHYSLGCGAAAMAQYLNYYKYPKHGIGTGSVNVKYDQATVTLTEDFSTVNYDWANMIDDYQGEYTVEQGMAVAQLYYHCGVAAKTTWNNLGGGTVDTNIIRAFIDHFGYNDTAHFVPRSRYDEPTWMEMVYTELSSGHPIFYSAKDINLEAGIIAGHNFILDGYDENGLVHVNWGWYGIENGYFDLATLAVREYTYDDWQAMYVGLYPKEPQFIRGDVDGDGRLSIADVTSLINALLTQSSLGNPASDVDDDGQVNIADVTALINILLSGNN